MPLTERAERDLAQIKSEPRAQLYAIRTPKRRRMPLYMSVAAAFVIFITVVFTASSARPVYAATPPLLVTRALDASARGAIQKMLNDAPDTPVVPVEPQRIRVQTWSLNVTDNGKLPSTVAPENVTVTRGADGSGSMVVIAGAAYDSNGQKLAARQTPAAGTVIRQETYQPSDNRFQFLTPPPASSRDVEGYLQQYAGLTTDSTAGAYLGAVAQLLMEWKLNGAQERALLTSVLERPGLQIVGSTVDRLGRDGVVVQAPAEAGYRNLLVISPSTARVLSFETMYVGHDRKDVPSPAVIAYYAWEGTK